MNRDRIEGVWKQLQGRLRQCWGVLTSSRLSAIDGAQRRLAGRIQERCGIAKDESRRELENFLHRNRNWNPGTPPRGSARIRDDATPGALSGFLTALT
jgi:uncharacterized protein YjbJ (UPF0337 family)